MRAAEADSERKDDVAETFDRMVSERHSQYDKRSSSLFGHQLNTAPRTRTRTDRPTDRAKIQKSDRGYVQIDDSACAARALHRSLSTPTVSSHTIIASSPSNP